MIIFEPLTKKIEVLYSILHVCMFVCDNEAQKWTDAVFSRLKADLLQLMKIHSSISDAILFVIHITN